jgi:hypothetical protein
MRAGKQIGLFLLMAAFAARADDIPGETVRVRLIAGLTEEKAYLPRFKAIRSLATPPPLTESERSALLAFLRRTDGTAGTDEMELAALKNDTVEHLLKLPAMPGGFARELLEMQADPAQSATWRNYCVQFLGRVYASTPGAELRAAARARLFLLAESPDPETCGTALLALATLDGNPEIDSARAAARAMATAKDPANKEGLRFTALQVAADLGHADAVPLSREWLAGEKSANIRAVAVGVLGKHGAPSDRGLIEPYLTHPDPRLGGAARAALKLPRKRAAGE